AGCVLIPVDAGEGALGALLAKNVVLLGCQLLAPCGVGLFNLLHVSIVGPIPRRANGRLRPRARKRRPRALGPAFAGEGQGSPFRQARLAAADRRINGWAAMSINSPRAASSGLSTDGGGVAVSGSPAFRFPAAGALTPWLPPTPLPGSP